MMKYLVKAQRALIGEKLQVLENAVILVENDKIVSIGRQDEITCIQGAYKEIELGDVTLMPGLIDCHSHTSMDARLEGHLEMTSDPAGDLAVRSVALAKDDLMSGITTCRILGDKQYVDISVRNAINNGLIEGPRLLVAGIGMRSVHGHGFIGVPHTGVQEFLKTCRNNMLRKVEWLKVFVTAGAPPINSDYIPSFLSLEEIECVTSEAKRMGIRTSAHCIGGEGLIHCIKAGIDVIDHAYCATDSDLELIKEHDRWVCLTPSVFMDLERNTKNTKSVQINTEKGRDRVIKTMQKIVTSGVKYAIGSDALHASMGIEAGYAVELGASNYDALAGVTTNAAKLCGVDTKCGSLDVGKYADLIAVEGNPLDHIDSLNHVRFVMKSGVRYR